MKVIKTKYKGYRFRSRLEARWAVFFDACGVKWEYEPEGFDLGDGIYYLPDFLLHDVLIGDVDSQPHNIWIEVKGQMTKDDSKKINKFNSADVGTNESRDDDKEYWKYAHSTPLLVVMNIPNGNNLLSLFDSCNDYSIETDRFYTLAFNFETIYCDCWTAFPCISKKGKFAILGEEEFENIDEKATVKAYETARQARFEHGETPNIYHEPLPSLSESLIRFIKNELDVKNVPYEMAASAIKKLSALEKECGAQNVINALRTENIIYNCGVKSFLTEDKDDGTYDYIENFARYPEEYKLTTKPVPFVSQSLADFLADRILYINNYGQPKNRQYAKMPDGWIDFSCFIVEEFFSLEKEMSTDKIKEVTDKLISASSTFRHAFIEAFFKGFTEEYRLEQTQKIIRMIRDEIYPFKIAAANR